MAPSDLPANFSFPNFVKIFVPGFLAVVLFSLAIIPIVSGFFWSSLSLSDKFLAWIIFGTVFGMLLTSVEKYMYQFFEGILWPEKIRQLKYKRLLDNFFDEKKMLEEFKAKNESELKKLKSVSPKKYEKMSKITEKFERMIQLYPYYPEKRERYPQSVTLFGNVMQEYESYPEVQYGMKMSVFLPHIKLILSKENREYLNTIGARADLVVYISFIFLIYSPFAAFGFSYQLFEFYNIKPNIYSGILFFMLFIAIMITSLLIAYIFYKISMQNLYFYGKFVKAVFDLYRIDLAKKSGITIKPIADEEEIQKCGITIEPIANEKEIQEWRKYGEFLSEFKK